MLESCSNRWIRLYSRRDFKWESWAGWWISNVSRVPFATKAKGERESGFPGQIFCKKSFLQGSRNLRFGERINFKSWGRVGGTGAFCFNALVCRDKHVLPISSRSFSEMRSLGSPRLCQLNSTRGIKPNRVQVPTSPASVICSNWWTWLFRYLALIPNIPFGLSKSSLRGFLVFVSGYYLHLLPLRLSDRFACKSGYSFCTRKLILVSGFSLLPSFCCGFLSFFFSFLGTHTFIASLDVVANWLLTGWMKVWFQNKRSREREGERDLLRMKEDQSEEGVGCSGGSNSGRGRVGHQRRRRRNDDEDDPLPPLAIRSTSSSSSPDVDGGVDGDGAPAFGVLLAALGGGTRGVGSDPSSASPVEVRGLLLLFNPQRPQPLSPSSLELDTPSNYLYCVSPYLFLFFLYFRSLAHSPLLL